MRVCDFSQCWGQFKSKVKLPNDQNSRTFIDLFDVTLYSNGQLLTKIPFLCINKPAIAFLSEEEFARTSGGRLTSPFAC
jgi:hypothetical protein